MHIRCETGKQAERKQNEKINNTKTQEKRKPTKTSSNQKRKTKEKKELNLFPGGGARKGQFLPYFLPLPDNLS